MKKLSERMHKFLTEHHAQVKMILSGVPDAGTHMGICMRRLCTLCLVKSAHCVCAFAMIQRLRLRRRRRLFLPTSSSTQVTRLTSLTPRRSRHRRSYVAHHRPRVKPWKSIDAFYWESPPADAVAEVRTLTYRDAAAWIRDHRLLLFQMTVSPKHPVNASGLIDRFSKLGVLDEMQADPTRAALIFVVPRNLVNKFQHQAVVSEAVAETSPVRSLDNVGKTTCQDLWAIAKIVTVKDLAEAIARNVHVELRYAASWNRAVRSWATFGQPQRDAAFAQAMAAIPQYVCSVGP